MRKKTIIGSAAAGAVAGVALVVFSRGGDRVVSRLRQRPEEGDGADPLQSHDAEASRAALDVDKRVAEIASRTVPQVVAQIATLSDAELRRLRAHERAHKNRVSVLRAIERALA